MIEAAKVHVPSEAASAPSETPKKRRGRRRLYTRAAKRGRASRRKGAEGEIEVRNLAREAGFDDAARGAPMQNAGGEVLSDVTAVGRLWIESKRYRRTPVNRFAREVLSEERPGFVSVLVYRDDRQPEPYAVLTLRELLKLERDALGNAPPAKPLPVLKAIGCGDAERGGCCSSTSVAGAGCAGGKCGGKP